MSDGVQKLPKLFPHLRTAREIPDHVHVRRKIVIEFLSAAVPRPMPVSSLRIDRLPAFTGEPAGIVVCREESLGQIENEKTLAVVLLNERVVLALEDAILFLQFLVPFLEMLVFGLLCFGFKSKHPICLFQGGYPLLGVKMDDLLIIQCWGCEGSHGG
jgi:hypothetical protein